MDTYIVRIHRDDKKRIGGSVGLVEPVGGEGTVAFKTLEELARILDFREMLRSGKPREHELKRLQLKLPVIVRGVDIEGKRFRENTTTEDLSHSGANFHMKRLVPMGASLSMVIAPGTSDLKVKASVVRCAELAEKVSIGVLFE